MQHYEIMLIIHPNQSDEVPEMLKRLQQTLFEKKVKVHRAENVGRRGFSYPIKRLFKGHYVLLNIECTVEGLAAYYELTRFNDAIIRSLVIKRDKAYTEKSLLLLDQDEGKTKKSNVIDYKNVYYLKKFLMENGRIMPGRVNNLNRRMQAWAAREIKYSRYLGLLKYCDSHRK